MSDERLDRRGRPRGLKPAARHIMAESAPEYRERRRFVLRLVSSIGKVFAVFSMLVLVGCVLREEKIRISRDGAVAIALELTGTIEEMTGGDAMPSEESGWVVEKKIEKKDDGEELVLTSERTFPPGAELPGTFAASTDPLEELYLAFPTSLRTERRADGLYFFFRRVYSKRPWGYMQHWKDVCFDSEVKQLSDKPIHELTPRKRRKVVESFLCDEAFAQAELARLALLDSEPDLAVEYGLMARQALMDYYRTDRHVVQDREGNVIEPSDDRIDRVIDQCGSLDDADRDTCYDEEAGKILREGLDAYLGSLRDRAGFSNVRVAEFEAAFERAQRFHELTEIIGGHHFEVDVEMPGVIIAHNADDVEVDEAGGVSEVSWEFTGKVLRDRPHELIAISRLSWDAEIRNGSDEGDR